MQQTPVEIPRFEELDPLVYAAGWGLKDEEVALELRLTANTIRAYRCKGSSWRRKPSSTVKALTAERHNKRIEQNQIPINPNLFMTV